MGFAGISAEDWQIIGLTLKIATVAVIVSLPVALAVAYLLSRTRFPGKILVEALVNLPLVLPPVVTGYALLLTFGRHGWVGRKLDEEFGIVLAFLWTGAALAAAVMGFPFMVRGIRLSFDAIDRDLEGAATSLGAPAWLVFLTITVPLSVPGILSGIVLAFARSLGEFGATITFVSSIPGETRTISSAIYALLQTPLGDNAALKLCGISVVLSFAALIASEALIRRGQQRLAR